MSNNTYSEIDLPYRQKTDSYAPAQTECNHPSTEAHDILVLVLTTRIVQLDVHVSQGFPSTFDLLFVHKQHKAINNNED